MELLILQAPEF